MKNLAMNSKKCLVFLFCVQCLISFALCGFFMSSLTSRPWQMSGWPSMGANLGSNYGYNRPYTCCYPLNNRQYGNYGYGYGGNSYGGNSYGSNSYGSYPYGSSYGTTGSLGSFGTLGALGNYPYSNRYTQTYPNYGSYGYGGSAGYTSQQYRPLKYSSNS